MSSNSALINSGTVYDRISESVFVSPNLTLINSATVHDRIPESAFVSSKPLINSATVHDRIVPDHGCNVCSICVSVRVVTGPDLYVAFRSSSDQACSRRLGNDDLDTVSSARSGAKVTTHSGDCLR